MISLVYCICNDWCLARNGKINKARVEDTIDPSFDINSLKMGEASHPFRLVKSGRLLTFHFDNLQLTPKSEDEAKTKGYFIHSRKLNTALMLVFKCHLVWYLDHFRVFYGFYMLPRI